MMGSLSTSCDDGRKGSSRNHKQNTVLKAQKTVFIQFSETLSMKEKWKTVLWRHWKTISIVCLVIFLFVVPLFFPPTNVFTSLNSSQQTPSKELLTSINTLEAPNFLLRATSEVVFEFSEVYKPSVLYGTTDDRDLAVAFHSINFLDADANTLDVLIFGTPEAVAHQGEGWFDPENWPDVGEFQWAGTLSKSASVELDIPSGTEGLLLNITSILNDIWMDVRVDNQLVASLRVDSYWHSGYVPIGAPTFIPAPPEGPVWPENSYFPYFPSTDRLYAIRVRHELLDQAFAWSSEFRINQSYETMMALTLVGMQGIINRNGSSVYLDWTPSVGGDTSYFWIPHLAQHIDVVYLDLDGLSAVNFLLRRYAPRFKGAVIYDPAVPDTINLATMIAGLEDRMILAPEQLDLPGIPNFASITDLRLLVEDYGWTDSETSKENLYHYVYDNLWPNLEHHIIGVISPGPPTSREIPDGTGSYFPLGMAFRDYIVALRLPALWLSPTYIPQAVLFSQFLADAPSNIPVFGFFWANEEETMAIVSGHGDWNPVFTNPNVPVSVGSMTVLSGVRPQLKPYQSEMDIDRIFATLGQSPVVTMWSSDGDAINFLTDRGYHGLSNFVWEEVRDHRFGWSTNPTLIDLAPVVWNYYVESHSKASFICGLSGAGYMYPTLMDDIQLRAYLEYTSRYLSDSGLRTIWIDNRFASPPNYEIWPEVASTYYDVLQNNYLGAFTGLGSLERWGLGFYYAGVPTPAVSASYPVNSTNSAWITNDILNRNSGEVFMDLTAPGVFSSYPWHQGQVIEDLDAHDGKTLFFPQSTTPSGLIVWGPFASLAPGKYDVTFRLKVSQKQSNTPFAQLYAGIAQSSGWQMLTSKNIAPNDFTSADEYQDFTLSFILNEFTSNVEFRIEYFGIRDLFADYIHAIREGGLDLPVFTSVFIPLITSPQPLTETTELADILEQAGAIVLHPDEFMAALNPEFMIDWATPILGADNPKLADAQAQLAAGDYFYSLLTVRDALHTIPKHTLFLEVEENNQLFIVGVRANTWMTDLMFNHSRRFISFRTHGPPTGSFQADVVIPNSLLTPYAVIIDGLPISFTSDQNGTHTFLTFVYSQGPHQIEIVEQVTSLTISAPGFLVESIGAFVVIMCMILIRRRRKK
ncbi:MAG: hypothetical protein ACFFCZ_27300 [Promethearchaeota archaeon]